MTRQRYGIQARICQNKRANGMKMEAMHGREVEGKEEAEENQHAPTDWRGKEKLI